MPAVYRAEARRIALIAESFERLLGRPLVDLRDDPLTSLWQAPVAIVAHDGSADPVFFFGNATALAAFETSLEAFTAMPSRLSAEPDERATRQALLDRVARDGFIDDYSGIRISAKGRRFRIADAVVWNLVDADGKVHGQAATFVV